MCPYVETSFALDPQLQNDNRAAHGQNFHWESQINLTISQPHVWAHNHSDYKSEAKIYGADGWPSLVFPCDLHILLPSNALQACHAPERLSSHLPHIYNDVKWKPPIVAMGEIGGSSFQGRDTTKQGTAGWTAAAPFVRSTPNFPFFRSSALIRTPWIHSGAFIYMTYYFQNWAFNPATRRREQFGS